MAAVANPVHPCTPTDGGMYQAVAASQTDKVLGSATAAAGDFLGKLIISVATSATGTVSIKDGAGSAIVITAANTPIGVYEVWISLHSAAGAWSVTTGAGVTVLATGLWG